MLTRAWFVLSLGWTLLWVLATTVGDVEPDLVVLAIVAAPWAAGFILRWIVFGGSESLRSGGRELP
jgi:hypothetical protein